MRAWSHVQLSLFWIKLWIGLWSMWVKSYLTIAKKMLFQTMFSQKNIIWNLRHTGVELDVDHLLGHLSQPAPVHLPTCLPPDIPTPDQQPPGSNWRIRCQHQSPALPGFPCSSFVGQEVRKMTALTSCSTAFSVFYSCHTRRRVCSRPACSCIQNWVHSQSSARIGKSIFQNKIA